jgi:hypothetical protein
MPTIGRQMSQTLPAHGVSERPADDPLTAAAIGVVAATLAAICHETLGHGLGCIAAGGHITLLTSIFFRCRGGNALTDLAGPLGNLVAGSAAAILLRQASYDRHLRLFLVMVAGVNLLWFSAQLVSCAVLDRDDWSFVALQLRWPAWWRMLALPIGIAAYGAGMRLHASQMIGLRQRTLRIAYAAAAGSAVVAGLAWAHAPIRSAFEGFLTVGVAPSGLLIVAARHNLGARSSETAGRALSRFWAWIIFALTSFAVFVAVQGRGIGPLAKVGLPS